MHEQLQAIITVLSLINPAICAAMFARAVAGQSPGREDTMYCTMHELVRVIGKEKMLRIFFGPMPASEV
jgi:hypothetical protein